MSYNGINNEFDLYDADDNQHAENTLFLDDFIDTVVFGDMKTFPTGNATSTQPTLSKPATAYSSLPSHRGSASSSSSRVSGLSNSPKTSPSSADAMMTDGAFSGWNLENDTKHNGSNFMFDTVDPTTMDMAKVFDFESASSSPSPPINNMISDVTQPSEIASNGPAAKRIKGHHKAQSVGAIFSCDYLV